MGRFGKALEVRLRRALIRTAGRFGGRKAHGRSLTLPERPRILLLRHDRIGDAIVSTPIFTLLRERFPEAHIDLLLGRRNRAVAPLLPEIDETHALTGALGHDLALLRRLRARRYDLCINLLAKDSASGAMLTLLSGARQRIGFEGEMSAIYDVAVASPSHPLHIITVTSRVLEPLGIEPIGDAPRREVERLSVRLSQEAIDRADELALPLLRDVGSPVVMINISAGSAIRTWTPERFAELANGLQESGISPIFVGAPSERETLERLQRLTGCNHLPAVPSLVEFAGMLRHAGIVLSPDTSTVHLAVALGRPVVVPVVVHDPLRISHMQWTPWGVPHRVLQGNETVAAIPVTDVVAAILSLDAEIRRELPVSDS